jgi:MinD superfamily P-loop ATPase
VLKQITVLSGKGGTGKTTLVAAFAALTHSIVVTDCDVDAPDLHLLLQPRIMETQEFKGSRLAAIDPAKCIQCGKCEEFCRFDAITEWAVDPVLCEGCGVCAYVCPVEAIEWKERLSGYAYLSQTTYGLMSHARLNPGEENSGKLVTLVRQNARQLAETEGCELILNDGPPGIGCPVIASVGGVNVGLIVVEPTLSGIHDMERALALLAHFQIPPLVGINKYDINLENTSQIDEFCRTHGIAVAGKIPFDPVVTRAMVAGQPVVVYSPNSSVSEAIAALWTQTLNHLHGTS